MLGEHFVGDKGAVATQTSVSYHARAFAEKVRQHTVVNDGDIVAEIGDDEVHLETPRRALQAALDHHAAEPEPLTRGYVTGGDFTRIEKERHVLPQSAQRERAGDGDTRNDTDNQHHSAPPRRHGVSPRS